MKVSLEQWATFVAVVETGSYAKAAELLDKSQSTLSYAVQKIETELNIRLFKMEGRKARLTDAGEAMLMLAKDLLKRAETTEVRALSYAKGVTPRVRLVTDALFPDELLFDVLNEFQQVHPDTQIHLKQTILSGTDQALLQGEADLVIGGRIPTGFSGIPLYRERFIAVAASNHFLHQRTEPLTLDDLRNCRQIVVSDAGQRNLDSGWLGAYQRWTFSTSQLSISAVGAGLGFAWLPELKIRDRLTSGELKPLKLESGAERFEQLYLILPDPDWVSPEVKYLFDLIQSTIKRRCEIERNLTCA